jgi:hypothetical protein
MVVVGANRHREAGGNVGAARGVSFSFLHERSLDVIVSLVGPCSYDATPLESRAHKLQDLVGGAVPDDAAAEEREVRQAVATITSLLERGHGVAVHCRMGVGRTGLVIGSVLVTVGHDPVAVTSWLDAVQRKRGVKGWPESPWQADLLTSFSHGE